MNIPETVEELILVDRRNRSIGRAEKHAVHANGSLHRAFSVFLVDARGGILLQRRQRTKYHSAGLWANSCCGHPRPGERTRSAARRRLGEELGVDAALKLAFVTQYKIGFSEGLWENEIVHVYFGSLAGAVRPNEREVMAVSFCTLPALLVDAVERAELYTFWLKHYLACHGRELAGQVGDLVGYGSS